MALLNFKYGLFERLPATQNPGTIYVTADEKAMYVDLPDVRNADGDVVVAADRVRLSSVIIKESSRDLEPPYNPGAIYYFAEENALLRWDADGGDQGTGTWVQINSVKAIDDKILKVAEDVANNKDAITLLQNADTRIEGLITAEANRADAEEKRLAGLIGDADSGLTKALADEVTRADTEEKRLAGLIGDNSGAITTLQSDLDTAEGKITEIETAIGDNGLKGQLAGAISRIEANEGNIADNAEAIEALQTTVGNVDSGLVKGLADANAAITALQNKDDELTGDIADLGTNKVNVTTYNEKVAALEKSIGENATAAANAKKAADDAQADADENAGAITTLQTTVGDASSGLVKGLADANAAIEDLDDTKVEITDYNTKVGELTQAIAAAKKAGDDAQADADENAEAITALQNVVGNSGSGLVKGLADANTAITNLDNKIGNIPADSQAANVIDYINGQFEAANAMHYKEGIDTLSDLPTVGVEAGDTYVVIADFYDLDSSKSYYAGDLLIAAADQGDAETYNGGWTHVVTGYQASHDAKLSGADNKIKLTSLAGDGVSLGEIEVKTDDSMITATVVGDTLTLGLEWGSF